MTVEALQTPKFLRKTQLQSRERNTNFIMSDRDALELVTSSEATKVSGLMAQVYVRLKLANHDGVCRERENVLHFFGEVREGKYVKAWDVLCQWLGVSSQTARKTLVWLHEKQVIGYKAFKNQLGIVIFLNRASSSIALDGKAGREKILQFSRASNNDPHASQGAAAFIDTYGDLEDSEKDLKPQVNNGFAGEIQVGQKSFETVPGLSSGLDPVSIGQIVCSLVKELETCVNAAAVRAAAREHGLTRDWFESKALPKAVRVAQRESYQVLRKYGLIVDRAGGSAWNDVGRSSGAVASEVSRLDSAGIAEAAELCVVMLEAQGKSVDVSLAEICSESGGWVLPDDVSKVREAALKILVGREGKGA